MVWAAGAAGATVAVWVVWGAALKLALPAWSAWTTQDPVALKYSTVPTIEHTEVEPEAMEKVTGNPEVAVAVNVWPSPGLASEAGEVKEIVWSAFTTVALWVTWGAALKP